MMRLRLVISERHEICPYLVMIRLRLLFERRKLRFAVGLRLLLFEPHELRLAVESGDPTTAEEAFHLCYRAVQIASLLLQELGEMSVCVGRPRVQLERASEQTLRAVDVPTHGPQHASEVDVRGDVRWVMF